jgi:hypothetical protein
VAIVSVTRLRLRSFRFILHLHWVVRKIQRSLEKTPGFVHGKLLADRHRAFWTMTLWKDATGMLAFRSSRVHTSAFTYLNKWCDEASVVHWETNDETLPSWEEAHRRMSESGKSVPLKLPSADHRAHRVDAPCATNSRQRSIEPRKVA